MMPNYTLKNKTVEAVQFKGSTTDYHDVQRWLNTGVYSESQIKTQDIRHEVSWVMHRGHLAITANLGDFIVKSELGNYYTMPEATFKFLFEFDQPKVNSTEIDGWDAYRSSLYEGSKK